VQITAKEDYAVRAAIELAVAAPGPLKREQIARAQEIPIHFLEHILLELKRAELVESQRGAEGGFRLSRAPGEITVADIVRAVTGPLATVRGTRPPALEYTGHAEPLQDVWIALRANIRSVLETVTLAHLAAGKLPARVQTIARDPVARR
jgi:Rrf2 family protein